MVCGDQDELGPANAQSPPKSHQQIKRRVELTGFHRLQTLERYPGAHSELARAHPSLLL
jgi:hypothetical protein